jgi:DNA-binding transcriptional LysR family regulator
MDVKRLEIFLKILETKSLSKTAAALGLAQPSVSASLKTLEDSIGYKLFDRTPRAVKPLPQALILAPYARRVLETLGEAAWALGSQGGGPKESLVVGASSLPAMTIAPEALKAFKSLYPNVHIKLKAGESESVIRRVNDGEFDIGLVGLRHLSPELRTEIIAHDDLCLLAAGGMCDRLGSPPASLEEIADWPLIMREDGSGTKAAFLKAFAKRPDLLPKLSIAAEVEGLLPALALARAGLGAVIISGLAAYASWILSEMRLIPLDFLGIGRNFYLVRRKSNRPSPLMKEFIRTVKSLPAHGGKE